MKNSLLFCFLFLCFSFVYCQTTFTKKYNSILERYEYFDSSNTLIGYQKYNTIMDVWEYTDLTTTNKTNSGRYIVHDYGTPRSNFDANLALQALAYRQANYNNMSSSQRAALSMQQRKQWVSQNLQKWIKYSNKLDEKNKKELNRDYKNLKKQVDKNDKIDMKNLDDGWYEVVMFYYGNLADKGELEEIYKKRYVFISDHKPVYYLGENKILFQVLESKSLKNEHIYLNKVSHKYNPEIVKPDFFILNSEPLSYEPINFIGTKLIFYTDVNLASELTIDIVNLNTDQVYYLPKITQYFTSSSPTCNTKDGVSTVLLPPGKYRYFAHTATDFWDNEFTIGDDACKSINLTK